MAGPIDFGVFKINMQYMHQLTDRQVATETMRKDLDCVFLFTTFDTIYRGSLVEQGWSLLAPPPSLR